MIRPADLAFSAIVGTDYPALMVEVGVRFGEHAVSMLELFPQAKVFLVDNYEPYEEPGFVYGLDYQRHAEERLQQALQPFANRSWLMRFPSLIAVKRFEPGTLDFVYLDAKHDKESVAADMAAWWPRIKSGGILAGHDFDLFWPGVIEAVQEFMGARGLAFDARDDDWWVRRP